MTRKFTGRHVAAILVTFFGVVMAVNLTMAYLASATFGGLVVKNSYVASQQFNGRIAQGRAEAALGWSLALARGEGGRIEVTLASAQRPLAGARIEAMARHPLGREPERALRFAPLGEGRYRSLEALPAGRWIIQVRASAGGRAINREIDLT
jgi:nitrogen fixation protein FixH